MDRSAHGEVVGATPTGVDSSWLLETRGLIVSFGGVRAVDGLDLRVRRASLTGLIGPNGAGKTSTIDALTGFTPCRGRVLLEDRDITDLAPHRRAHAGLGRTWQSVELFEDLTVEENCIAAAEAPSLRAVLADLVRPGRHRAVESVVWALGLLGLGSLARRVPAELSLGQRKLVGVARALAGRPTMLLLDEPAAGLDTGESRLLGERLQTVVEAGVTVLLIDHDMGLVLGVCDRVSVIDYGRQIAEGTPAEVRSDERVIAAYLGTANAGGDP